ncbi:MAG: hypothetical protein AAFW69_08420 [Pseudomonadota bacterium]
MSVGRALAALLTAGVAAGAWYVWDNLGPLRRAGRETVLGDFVNQNWEYRYLMAGAVIFLLLSLIEWIAGRLDRH